MNGVERPEGLGAFAGRWRLHRRIDDALAGTEGVMDGWAEFRPEGVGLICEERGVLRFGEGPPLEAKRCYFWRAEAPGRIAVAFEDGRPFHSFALGPAAIAEHDCAADHYKVDYDFADWPRWRAIWRVNGPRKDYVSVSDYGPEASLAQPGSDSAAVGG